jgi:hypothetical protein
MNGMAFEGREEPIVLLITMIMPMRTTPFFFVCQTAISFVSQLKIVKTYGRPIIGTFWIPFVPGYDGLLRTIDTGCTRIRRLNLVVLLFNLIPISCIRSIDCRYYS